MLARLLELRPFAYHTSSETNFASIKRSGALMSTAELLAGTANTHLLQVRRTSSQLVQVRGGVVEIRDNLPLRIGSLDLEPGCSLQQFLLMLNQRVFLWPGNAAGPTPQGREHFAHYRGQGPVHILRVPLKALIAANPNTEIQVTFCNSGSARHHGGKPAIRGPSTFQAASASVGAASKVKELCFVGSARLPAGTEWSETLTGPWQLL